MFDKTNTGEKIYCLLSVSEEHQLEYIVICSKNTKESLYILFYKSTSHVFLHDKDCTGNLEK